MKYIPNDKLAELDSYWQKWPEEALSPKQKRIRLRLQLVYLLVRHGGLRLGEALALNDNRDIIPSTSTIHIPGDRDVRISEQRMAEILHLLENPLLGELHGKISHIDPGYVRKNFYLAATSCGMESTLGGPRILRHSRGAELLAQGVPVSIVQKMLGLQSPVQAVQLREFCDNDAHQIIHAHLRREALRHSSARNAFAGNISTITETLNMAELVITTISGLDVRAIISIESMRSLNLRKGQTVTATVKAPWIVLSPENTPTSCSNNFPGTVLFIKRGTLEASVRLRLDDGTGMAAVMTAASVESLGLAEGSRVTASFSAMSVIVSAE